MLPFVELCCSVWPRRAPALPASRQANKPLGSMNLARRWPAGWLAGARARQQSSPAARQLGSQKALRDEATLARAFSAASFACAMLGGAFITIIMERGALEALAGGWMRRSGRAAPDSAAGCQPALELARPMARSSAASVCRPRNLLGGASAKSAAAATRRGAKSIWPPAD